MDTQEDGDMPTGSDRMRIVSQEAAYWYFRWTDDASGMPREDQRKFIAWTRKSPENIAEFLRISKMDGRFARRKLRDQISKCNSNVVQGDFGNSVSQYDYQPCASVSDKVPRKRKPWSMSGLAASVGALSLTLLLGFAVLHRTREGVIETVAAEWQHMTVEDGSNIHMDARTRLKVDMTDRQRIIHLYTGRAAFDVVSNRERPFTVRTELVDVTAVGTRFSVQIDESGVTAIVEEGVVEVTPRDGQEGEAVRLYPGEKLSVPKTKVKTLQLSEREKKKVDAKLALQWTTGWIDLHGTTVSQAVKEFNRRHGVQVRIGDPDLGARSLDYARLRVDSVNDFKYMMQSQGGIAVNDNGSVITLTPQPRSE